MVACHKDLKPKLVEEYEEDFELLVVEIEVKKKQIRVFSGYGPQENWKEEKRMNFFTALETEIEKAMLAGKSKLWKWMQIVSWDQSTYQKTRMKYHLME